MTENQAREEIVRVGASLYARGYAHASAGNISVLLDDGHVLITPTDACLGTLNAAELSLLNPAGEQLSGAQASKTVALHRRIYAASPGARCILHTHSRHLVALTLRGVWKPEEVLPAITPYYVMKVGPVPLVAYHRPGDPAVAVEVAQLIQRAETAGLGLRGVLLERLGPVVWHSSPAQASAVLEELEETAALWLMSSPAPRPLDDAQVAELRRVFGGSKQG